jgi:hypothetical protein
MPLPTTINNISVQDYLEKANTERTSIINQVDKMMVSQKTSSPSDRMQATMANQPDAVLKNALDLFLKEKNPNSEVRAAIKEIEAELVRRGFGRNQQPAPAPAPTQQPAANLQTAPAQPVSVGGVTLNRTAGRNNAGQPTPTLVTYKNQQYNLMDDGRWLTVFGKPVNTATASFLQTELESIS